MKNWKVYMYLILVYVLMQVGSIFLAEAMVNYLSERPGFTKEQAAYQRNCLVIVHRQYDCSHRFSFIDHAE